MNSPDSASLQNLNDIVLPAATGWWPLAPGWYFLAGLLLIVLAWCSYRSIKRWKSNRYRRIALHELQSVVKNMQSDALRDSSLRQVPVLLKRAALSAYPRHEVASLSGKGWHDFLNSKVGRPTFTESTFNTLEIVSYSRGQLNSIDNQAARAMVDASGLWLKHHQHIIRDQGQK